MVNMTNSLYTQQQTNIKKENEQSTEFMNINADEAEAGTILMSLSQQTKKTPTIHSLPTTKTMSIRNLLGEEKEEEKEEIIKSKQTEWNNAETNVHHHSILLSNDMHRYPETTKEIHSHLYPERIQYNHHHHSNNNHIIHSNPSPHPTATTSLPLPPPSHHRSDTIQQQQQQKRYLYSHSSHSPIKSIQDQHTSFSQQPLQSMRSNPKVKRNALHAYISYMTYSDMTKQKPNNPMTYHHHQQHQQHHHHQSSMVNPPITPLPTNFSSDRSHSPSFPPPSSTLHPSLPLTAYLKQHMDPPSSTSQPHPSSTMIHHHPRQRTYSNGWSSSSYSSYPPPSSSTTTTTNDKSTMNHSHFQYSYPHSSSSSTSMKHPYDKNI
ncbi:unnamed protein product [Cunninghamella blakesleeana]